MTAHARSRIYVRGAVEEGQQDAISITYTLPFNAVLLQWMYVISDMPTEDEIITIERQTTPAEYTHIVAEQNPGADARQYFRCNERAEFKIGDVVQVDYANTDNNAVAVELVFAEAD